MQSEQEKTSVGISLLCIAVLALFGAIAEGENGLILGGLLGFMLAQIFYLRGRVSELRTRIRLQEMLSAAQTRKPETGAAPVPPETESPVPPVPLLTPEAETETESVAWVAPEPVTTRAAMEPPAPREPIPPPPPSAFDKAFQEGLAWFTRGNPLARAGVVILFFGGAFLAKYAAEHSMFPVELRFIGIAAIALTLLVLGWRLRDSRSVYAQTLQGGGIAGLYLTVFAATRLYQMLPPGFALSLMVVVALSAAVLAVAQNALALAVIGTAGGFLAPILVSTGSANHVALFTYYTVLNLGIFTVAWFRAWRVLNLLGFVFTFGITGAFRAFAYAPEKLASTDLFLWLFFVLYVAVSVLFSLRQKTELKGYVSSSLVFGLPLVVFGIHGSLVSEIEYALAWSALGLGAFYLALAWLLFRSRIENLRLLCEAFGALGLIFGSLAVPLAFDAQTTAATWAVEGAGLLWIGVRQQRKLARAFGALLQVLGGIGYLGSVGQFGDLPPILNSAYLGSSMLAVAGLLSGRWLFRNSATAGVIEKDLRSPALKGTLGPPWRSAHGAAQAGYEKSWESAAALWATLWWLGGGLAEIQRSFADVAHGATLIYFSLSAALLHLIGARWVWPFAQRIALALTPLGAVLVLAWMLPDQAHPFSQFAALGWPLLLAVHFWLLWREDRETAPGTTALPWLHAGAVWLIALLGAWEIHWRVEQEVPGVWRDLSWGLIPAALLWLLSRPSLKPAWPLARHEDSYRLLAAAPLAAFGLLWLLVMNLSSNGDAGWLPYLPLLNPLDVSAALLLASLIGWWLSLSTERRLRLWSGDANALTAALTALVFLWLNAALIRALHWQAGTPLSLQGIAHSTVVQAALSVFWGLLGFATMVFATRRARRKIWIVGAGLMALVVAKLFLVDLSGTGTLARIVSFLVVGGLLLVTGYWSPLPPRKEESAA